jgi:hypothetical protein
MTAMASMTARTFPGPESDSPPLPGAPPATGAVWVGVYAPDGTQLAGRRANVSGLGGEPFVAELFATAAQLGYTVTSAIRAVGDEVEFDVEPRP